MLLQEAKMLKGDADMLEFYIINDLASEQSRDLLYTGGFFASNAREEKIQNCFH